MLERVQFIRVREAYEVHGGQEHVAETPHVMVNQEAEMAPESGTRLQPSQLTSSDPSPPSFKRSQHLVS